MRVSEVKRRALLAARAYFRRGWSLEDVKSFSSVSPSFIYEYLRQVYLTQYCVLQCSAAGLYWHRFRNTGGLITIISFLGSFILYCYVPLSKRVKWKRWCLLLAAAFFGGASIVPLIGHFASIDLGVLAYTVQIMALIPVFFAAGTMFPNNRVYLYSLGLISPGIISWFPVAYAIVASDASHLWSYTVYFWFLCYTSYIVLYSQELAKLARTESDDFVGDALKLFYHFPGVLVHFITVLVKRPSIGRQRRRPGQRG